MNRIKSFAASQPLPVRIVAAAIMVCCMVSVLSVVAFAKTTYVITDGDQGLVHKTYESDPEKVLGAVGVELGHTDRYVTQPSWGRHEITVHRAKHITIDYLGEKMQLLFYGNTVSDLLKQTAIDIPEGAYLSAGLGDAVYDGMRLTVSTGVTVTEDYTAVISYKTEYVYTDYLPEGKQVVLSSGSNGVAQCHGYVTYINGQISQRFPITQIVVSKPVNRLVAVGTGHGKAKQGMPIVGQNKLLTWEGEVLEFTHKDEFKATCYYRFPVDGETTANGTPTRVGAIAVDPKVIPYWTKMYIVTQDGEYIYGVAVAEDCGTAIKGKWVDLFYDTYEEACNFGRRQVDIYFLA